MRRVVRTVAATFAAVANTKGLDYRVTVTDDVPRWLLCDETRLQQIIGNLVGACRAARPRRMRSCADGRLRLPGARLPLSMA